MWVNSTTVVVVGAGVAERRRVIWGGVRAGGGEDTAYEFAGLVRMDSGLT